MSVYNYPKKAEALNLLHPFLLQTYDTLVDNRVCHLHVFQGTLHFRQQPWR